VVTETEFVPDMMDLFESLPLPASMLIVATISVVVVALVAQFSPSRVMWIEALILPFGIAYVIYWAPVWISHSTNVADYLAWAPIFYGS
jgi:hypothetical protein